MLGFSGTQIEGVMVIDPVLSTTTPVVVILPEDKQEQEDSLASVLVRRFVWMPVCVFVSLLCLYCVSSYAFLSPSH